MTNLAAWHKTDRITLLSIFAQWPVEDNVEECGILLTDGLLEGEQQLFPGGPVVSDQWLCQPAPTANVCAVPLPAVVLIRFWESFCGQQQLYSMHTGQCIVWLGNPALVFNLIYYCAVTIDKGVASSLSKHYQKQGWISNSPLYPWTCRGPNRLQTHYVGANILSIYYFFYLYLQCL